LFAHAHLIRIAKIAVNDVGAFVTRAGHKGMRIRAWARELHTKNIPLSILFIPLSFCSFCLKNPVHPVNLVKEKT
jgi:hypothetical protein